MARTRDIVIILAVTAFIMLGLGGYLYYQKGGTPELLLPGEKELTGPFAREELKIVNPGTTNTMNRLAVLQTNQGTITIELFESKMPITTGNFIALAEDGFYNNTKFHRVIDGFMIQGGDPNSKSSDTSSYGTGGPGYTVQDEFVSDEQLSNVRGTIAMANSGQPNSGGSQFFINLVDNTGLDFDKAPFSSRHPVFGRVVEGMDVVDAIARTQTGARDVPVDPIVIESVEIIKQ